MYLDLADQSGGETGDWRELDGESICVNDVEYPPDWNVVRQIRREFDPFFIPALVRTPWQTPTGREVVVVHHIICRQIPNPKTEIVAINPLKINLPVHPVLGIRLRHPIIAGHTLDGKSAEESSNGRPGYYVPFDGRVLQSMREIRWRSLNEDPVVSAKLRIIRRKAAEFDAQRARRKRFADDLGDQEQFRKPKVYVSDTLTKLRAAAASPPAA